MKKEMSLNNDPKLYLSQGDLQINSSLFTNTFQILLITPRLHTFIH